MRGPVEKKIVGDEAVCYPRQILLLDDRVPAIHDFDVIGVVKSGTAIIAVGGLGGKAGKNVDFGKS